MSGARTSRWCGLALGRQPNPTIGEGTRLKIRLGVDVACRAAHQASLADEQGRFLFVGHRFRTDPDELDTRWARLPKDAERIEVVMEPTRNACVALAAWFRRHGATVVMVPPEQSADLRDYYNKHTKTDRIDSKVLARLPLLHPEGLHREDPLGPGDELKRAVKIRSGLVHRRTACLARLDALLEFLGPAWIAALGSDMTLTALRFLARYANPVQVKRLGKARLAAFFCRCSRQAWADERADAVIEAAATTLRLWGADGGELDFDALAADIAAEARLALTLTDEINGFDQRIGVLYDKADPAGIVRSVPGAGRVCAPQILGRLGDPTRFANLAAVHARKVDPTLAIRYQRLMLAGKHHDSAVCTLAAVLLTRIAACLRAGTHYLLRDTDGRVITEAQGRAIVAERYTVPPEVRAARRKITPHRHPRRNERNERAKTGVATRSKASPVPQPA